MAQCEKARVLTNEQISNGIYKLRVENDKFIGVRPGQFFMLRAWKSEPILWRPISIAEVKENELVFIYAKVGKGTEFLAALETGDTIEVMGALGNGFDIESAKGKVALVCGGIGIAPMLELSKHLKNKPDLYAGFREDVYLVDDMKEYVNEINLAVESGKVGHKGYVTEIFDAEKYDTVLCCGPEIMMFKVVDMCRKAGTKIYVSMEKHMACGIGACLVCTCKTKGGNKRTCKDGPVFDGDEIVID
ncbi:dihydroorotate dehydrogenase electron transfer subunit [Clostridium oryzae]|uniref:Dihydroorotate dehydrogenase B (NAD(+)), electron transfer subunit n=1 Tax=Clostridium oryzae TaxID=1450648 RepID=A0A1V4IK48_9CLOT|nr:dihydroorotate dehydrogenase electron transfer subunit [Clostridium oryzae]OPJ60306.1 dihydroorotate dehydrogenase B, electron transfer subunit [Clostridium oryzae]